jgi:hypothetical protein
LTWKPSVSIGSLLPSHTTHLPNATGQILCNGTSLRGVPRRRVFLAEKSPEGGYPCTCKSGVSIQSLLPCQTTHLPDAIGFTLCKETSLRGIPRRRDFLGENSAEGSCLRREIPGGKFSLQWKMHTRRSKLKNIFCVCVLESNIL